MKAPVEWIAQYVSDLDQVPVTELAAGLVSAGLEIERIESAGAELGGPIVVGRVLSMQTEPHKNGKSINWCQVDVGEHEPRGIVCGAHNFSPGDLVVVALPGAVLPGNFHIAARKTYGHISDGMICSSTELGLGDDQEGIIVLDPDQYQVAPGLNAVDALQLQGDVLDIALTPDFGYCFSIRGLARESAIATGKTFTDVITESDAPIQESGWPAVLLDPRASHAVFLSITGITAQATSPNWLTRRLRQCGIRPINLIVDATNYVMLLTGHPLHAYDSAKLNGPIEIRPALADEVVTTLDGQQRTLLADHDSVIADKSGPIGLAGIMGGATTEVDQHTVDIVIESANFDQISVARSSRAHKLTTEASRRFERGVDATISYAAAKLCAELITQLAGGQLSGSTILGQPEPLPGQEIPADLPGQVLGADIPVELVKKILTESGVSVEDNHLHQRLLLQPPPWRHDLIDPYDYVEEVGRKYGIDRIEPQLAMPKQGGGYSRRQVQRRRAVQSLTDSGWVEVENFPFLGDADLDQLRISTQDARRSAPEIANPLSARQPLLRTTLLPGLFGAATRNTSRSNSDLALLEVGAVFFGRHLPPAPIPAVDRRPSAAERDQMDAALPQQPTHVGLFLSGDWLPQSWNRPAELVSWVHTFAAADILAAALGLSVRRQGADYPPFHPGRCAQLVVNDQTIGYAGELHPEVISAYGLPARSSALEVDLDLLLTLAPDNGQIGQLSTYPVTKEDVALIVGENVTVADVQESLVEGAGQLMESVRLFDVYRSEKIGAGLKSLAFALRFRGDHTLTEAEAAAARDAGVAVAVQRFGAEQRID